MRYLINKETKEHVIYVPWLMNSQWTLVEADYDGWIAHTGKECPLPDDARCDYRTGTGFKVKNRLAKNIAWHSLANHYDITHYKPILAEPVQEPEPQTIGDLIRRDHPYKDVKQAEKVQEQTKTALKVPPELQFTPGCVRCGAGGIAPHDPHCPNKNAERVQEPEPVVKESLTTDLLSRLKAAHEHAAQIPDIIAQIKAELEQYGHTVVPLSPFVAAVIAESEPSVEIPQDMSDWRNWREGDLVMFVDRTKWLGRIFKIITFDRELGHVVAISDDRVTGTMLYESLRFHSRPAKGEK